MSVARRVADERNEPAGNAIGYSVRHQTKRPRPHGSIEYCTTGVVLNQLQEDPKLANVTHVIVDEVHERDINTDFLLVLLKGMLKERPDLRVSSCAPPLKPLMLAPRCVCSTQHPAACSPLVSTLCRCCS